MATIEGNCREVCEATEFVAIVTMGDEGTHVVGNWGDYLRQLGVGTDTILLPAGHYHQTERNLRKNERVQLLVASKAVRGTRGPGQGYLISGRGEIVATGVAADTVRAKFPWARGALLIHVDEVRSQL